jgi:hypothetical protein
MAKLPAQQYTPEEVDLRLALSQDMCCANCAMYTRRPSDPGQQGNTAGMCDLGFETLSNLVCDEWVEDDGTGWSTNGS